MNCRIEINKIFFEGTLTAENMNGMDELQNKFPDYKEIIFELEGLDIEDGPAMKKFTSFIRNLLDNGTRLTIFFAPQLLAHNLYRIGCLHHQNLELRHTRMNEPYG